MNETTLFQVKDVRVRFTADDVLRHPWIRNDAPKTPLQTPDILFRYDRALTRREYVAKSYISNDTSMVAFAGTTARATSIRCRRTSTR